MRKTLFAFRYVAAAVVFGTFVITQVSAIKSVQCSKTDDLGPNAPLCANFVRANEDWKDPETQRGKGGVTLPPPAAALV